nr:hypothetical protein [Campylobacter sp.]
MNSRLGRRNLILSYVCLDFLLILVCSFFGAKFVLNSQLAMICASLILFASFYGYKKQVIKKAEILQNSDDLSLYQNNQIYAEFDENDTNLSPNSQNSSNLEPNLAQTNLEDPKEKISFSSFEIFTALKPFRLFSYAFLVAVFFVLKNNDLFEPFSFLSGLAVMPIGVFVAGIFNAKQI